MMSSRAFHPHFCENLHAEKRGWGARNSACGMRHVIYTSDKVSMPLPMTRNPSFDLLFPDFGSAVVSPAHSHDTNRRKSFFTAQQRVTDTWRKFGTSIKI